MPIDLCPVELPFGISLEAITEADLAKLLAMLLLRVGQLEEDVKQLRREVPSGKLAD